MEATYNQFITFWKHPEISKNFLKFILNNVEPNDEIPTYSDDIFYYDPYWIEKAVNEKGFKLPVNDENFFKIAKERNVDYVEFDLR